MHATFFALKRAFHGTLRITRASLARLGLTAARFDLMFALPHQPETFDSGMQQSALRGQLGVSRPTVSRMLASLEQLGLVCRRRDTIDKRRRVVALTGRGYALLGQAERDFIDSGWAELAVQSAFDGARAGGRWSDDAFCLFEIERFVDVLKAFRAAFRDLATLYYPWHPDD